MIFLLLLYIDAGRHAIEFLECVGKVFRIGKTDAVCHLGDGIPTALKQVGRFLHPYVADEVIG